MAEIGGSFGSGSSGTPKNPFNDFNFDDMRRSSAEAFKELQDRSKKAGDVNTQVAGRISSAYSKGAKKSEESMNDFFNAMVRASEAANKKMVGNATDMFNLHVQAQKKLAEHTLQAQKKTQQAMSVSQAVQNTSFNEMMSAWAIKVTHQDKLLDKLSKKSQDLTSSKKAGGHHPYVEQIERLNKLQAFGPSEIMGQLASRAGANAVTGTLGTIPSLLGEIGPAIMKLTPQIAMISGVTGIITSIVKELWELDTVRAKLAVEVGGDTAITGEFIKRINALEISTHKSRDELIEMADAFQQTGLKAMEGGKAMDDWLVIASDLNRITGLSNEQLANIAKSQTAAGKSASQTKVIYNDLYMQMQELGLTMKDFVGSVEASEGMWKNYGAISGSTMEDLQSDLMQTASLFKGLNIDVKHVGDSINSLYDPKRLNAQSIFVSQMTGISGIQARAQAMLDPSGFQQRLLAGAGDRLLQNKGAQWGMSREKLQAQGMSPNQIDSIFQNRMMSMRQLTEGGPHINQGELVQLMNNYQAYSNDHPGAGMDQFMRDRQKGMASGVVAGTIDKANNAINSTGAETMATLGREITGSIRSIADSVGFIAQKLGYHGPGASPVAHSHSSTEGTVTPPTRAASSISPSFDLGMPFGPTPTSSHATAGSVGAHGVSAPPPSVDSNGRVDIGNGFWLSGDAGRAFKAAQANAKAHGVNMKVNEAGRTFEHQAYLYKNRGTKGISPTVALPGHSNHEVGNALDIQNYAAAMPFLIQAGFVHGDGRGKIANDPWHFKYVGGKTASAKAFTGKMAMVPPPPGTTGLAIQKDMTSYAEYQRMMADAQKTPPLPQAILNDPAQQRAIAQQHLAEQKRTNDLLAKTLETHEQHAEVVKKDADRKAKIALLAPGTNTTSTDVINRRI